MRGIIRETCEAIWDNLIRVVMPVPTEEMWWRIANKFEDLWQFPNCIGAIDGKHVEITCPPKSGSAYHNHMGYFSVVLLALVDAENRFIAVDIGDLGSNSDGGIFSRSSFGVAFNTKKLHIPSGRTLPGMIPAYKIPLVVIGDEAFPSQEDLLRPYPGRKSMTLPLREEEYNFRLSRARRIVENSFGILSQRFRVYHRKLQLYPASIVPVVQATVVLHNYLTDPKEDIESVYRHLDVSPHFNRNTTGGRHAGLVDLPRIGNHPGAGAIRVRNVFTDFFVSNVGYIPRPQPNNVSKTKKIFLDKILISQY